MKKIFLVMAVAVLLITASACGGKKTEGFKLDLDIVADALTASGYFPDSMQAVDPLLLKAELCMDADGFEAKEEDIVDARYSMAFGVLADQFILIEGTDSDATDRLEKSLEKYRKDKKASFGFYAPDQASRLDNPITERRGNYLLFAVGFEEGELAKLCKRLMDGEKVEILQTGGGNNQESSEPKGGPISQSNEDGAEPDSGVTYTNVDDDKDMVNTPGTENIDESALIEAEQTARAYYSGTVFEVISLELQTKAANEIVFSAHVSKDGVVQEPNRSISLRLNGETWEIVSEGY